MSATAELEALLKEVDEIRTAIEATRGAIYTCFGVVLPGLVGVFVLTADKDKRVLFDETTLAVALIVLASFGIMWTQNLWMEILRYVRYYYIELMPRVYAASGQEGRLNFLEWSQRRSLRSWVPLALFNTGAFSIVSIAYGRYVFGKSLGLDILCICFLLGTAVSFLAVILEAGAVEKEIVNRRVSRSRVGGQL